MSARSVQTASLELIPASASLARAAAEDPGRLASLLKAQVPDGWPSEHVTTCHETTAETLERDPSTAGWWFWYWLAPEGRKRRTLVGHGGFCGPPDGDGRVWVHHELAGSAGRSEHVAEALPALLAWAFLDPRVSAVATEAPADGAAAERLGACGLRAVGAGRGAGSVRRELTREEHAARTGVDPDPFGPYAALPTRLRAALDGIGETSLRRPEGPDRWSVLDVLRHLADTELVYGYRMRKAVAEPGAALEAFDQGRWARDLWDGALLSDVPGLVTDIAHVRGRTVAWLRRLTVEQLSRHGVHSERGPESVAVSVRLMVEHDTDHLAQIARVRAAAEAAGRQHTPHAPEAAAPGRADDRSGPTASGAGYA